jgi:hypothetical protein
VMETLNEDYVRTARAKGAPEIVVMRSHVLRNAMLPVVTMLGMDIGLALGGAVPQVTGLAPGAFVRRVVRGGQRLLLGGPCLRHVRISSKAHRNLGPRHTREL